jgi:hypothetical protein
MVQALVRAVVIEVSNVAVEDAAGVSFVVDQHPVGDSERTLPTNRSA